VLSPYVSVETNFLGKQIMFLHSFFGGAGKKTGISEIRYIDMDISEIDTFDDVITDMSIIDISIAIKWTYRSGYIGNRYVHIGNRNVHIGN
jgi:hypothetical protein